MTVVTANAVPRSTEGPRPGAAARGRGRPKGSMNKPKSLVPVDLANEMLLAMKGQLPPEHFAYLKSVIKDGKAISTKTELDTLILLLSRNLYPALIHETKTVNEDGTEEGPSFRKDVTERLKVLNSLLTLRNQVEKRDDDRPGESTIIKVFAGRGVETRLALLIGNATESARTAPVVIDGVARDVAPA